MDWLIFNHVLFLFLHVIFIIKKKKKTSQTPWNILVSRNQGCQVPIKPRVLITNQLSGFSQILYLSPRALDFYLP